MLLQKTISHRLLLEITEPTRFSICEFRCALKRLVNSLRESLHRARSASILVSRRPRKEAVKPSRQRRWLATLSTGLPVGRETLPGR